MIVTCDACQTRFKIPDEKVTEKGVKVRCTKCGNTFRVTREASAPAAVPMPAPAPPPVQDPFAALGFGDPNSDELTRPAGVIPPPEARRTPDPFAGLGFGDMGNEELTRPAGVIPPPEARRTPDPFAGINLNGPGSEEITRPGQYLSAAAKLAFEAKPSTDKFGTVPPAPQFGFGEDDPFSEPTRVGPNPLAGPPMPTAAPPQAMPPPLPPRGSTGTQIVPPANLADQLFGESTETGPALQPDRSAFGGDDDGHLVPGSGQTGQFALGSDRAAFGADAGHLSASSGQTGQISLGSDRAMFDMPPPPPGAGSGLLDDVPEVTQPGFSTSTKIIAPPPESFAPPAPPPEPPLLQGTAEDVTRQIPLENRVPVEQREGPGAARMVSGAVVNIAIAGLLLIALAAVGSVYLNEGRLEWAALSPEHLASLWTKPPQVVTRDVSNGLYDAQGGHPVLFVRGEVENRTRGAGKVKVKVEIFDGTQLLKSAEVFAGKSPTPEDLAAISGPNDLDALTQKLNAAAQKLGPKGTAPFLVAFYEYPTDFTGLRLKVTATAVQ